MSERTVSTLENPFLRLHEPQQLVPRLNGKQLKVHNADRLNEMKLQAATGNDSVTVLQQRRQVHGTCSYSIQSRIDRVGSSMDEAYNKAHMIKSPLMKKKFYSTDKNQLKHANFTSTQHEGMFRRTMEIMNSPRVQAEQPVASNIGIIDNCYFTG
jgi:hypothetical protein